MIRRAIAIAAVSALLMATAASAQDDARPKAASDEQRAEAMLGLARIAGARGDWPEAHQRFTEGCRLRPCSINVLVERFWVAVHVDPAGAIDMAVELAARNRASRDVFEKAVTLVRATGAADAALQMLDRAGHAWPADAAWPRLRADIAIQAERDRQMALAEQAWSRVPAGARAARADWQASFLRVAASRSSRASVAPELGAFVAAHPEDAGMRRLAIEAWAEAGQPLRALDAYGPLLGADASAADVRRAADLARQGAAAAPARALLSRLVSMPGARTADVWALAEVLAADRNAAGLRTLLASPLADDDACATRLVSVVLASGDEGLLADLVPMLPASCATHAMVAGRMARVLVARNRPADAEHWLDPLWRPDRLDAEGRLTMARALTARSAWPEVEQVLSPVVAATGPETKDAAALLAWAWHAQGRSVEAWALAERLANPDGDAADARAGWAAMALAAGEFAAAERLADEALGSSRDVDARAVHAALAARIDRPADVRRALDPVVSKLSDAGHVLLWLDAIETLEGPRVALREAEYFDAIVATDAGLLGRRAAWAAAVGDMTSAAADVALLRDRDADAADRAAVAVSLIAGDGEDAWGRVSEAFARPGPRDEAWQRLRLDAALLSGRWSDAARQLVTLGNDLTDGERALAEARLGLGRDGTLASGTRGDLDEMVEAGSYARAALVLLARDEVASRRYDAALARLRGAFGDGAQADWPADARAVAADALMGLGRAADVLVLVGTSPQEPIDLRVLRARALVMSGQAAEGRTELARLARLTGRADVYRSWAGEVTDPDARVDVLDEAVARHPADQDLRVRHADALRLAGAIDAAVAEAEAIVRAMPESSGGWRVLVASGRGSAQDRAQVLIRARAAVGDDPDVVLLLAEGAAEGPAAPGEVVDLVSGWLNAVPPGHAVRAARAEATLAVGAGRWTMAREAIGRVRSLAPDDLTARRFEAEITAWSGEHAAAEPLFDAYLAAAPDDAAAWRQYARLLTCRNDRDGAERAYARARALAPTPGLSAEAATRDAVLRRDWPGAAAAASSWRALEPGTLDALVDLALARELSGDAAGAVEAYADLERWPQLPDTVRRTVDAFAWRQGPRGAGGLEIEQSEGFGGHRLVARREMAFTGDAGLPGSGRWRLQGRLAQGSLDTGPTDHALTEGQAGVRASIGPALVADLHLGAARVGGDDLVLAGVTLQRQLSRHLAIEASTRQKPFWENDETVRSGLHAWSTGARMRLLAAGDVDASAGVDYSVLSDGIRRQQIDASIGRQLGSGARLFELRASAFLFGFSERTDAYFSPSAFGRLDVEAGMTRWVGRGGPVRDGRFVVQGRVGSGVDTDGVPYLLSSGSVVVPFGSRFGLVGSARYTGARTYTGWSATIGVQAGEGRPGARDR